MCRFKRDKPRTLGFCSVFKYITCVGSSVSSAFLHTHKTSFKYITCVGSSKVDETTTKDELCLNTSHVSVQERFRLISKSFR